MTSRMTAWRRIAPPCHRARRIARHRVTVFVDGKGGDATASSSTPSVLVIGASGRTGREIVRECSNRGLSVLAGTQNGQFDVKQLLGDDAVAPTVVPWTIPLVQPVEVDVTRPETVENAVMGMMQWAPQANEKNASSSQSDDASVTPSIHAQPTVVIFAATANAKGDPRSIDQEGLVNVAKACIKNKVSRLVIISGAGVTQKNENAPAYKFLNRFGGRMDAKQKGEVEVMEVYMEAERVYREEYEKTQQYDTNKPYNPPSVSYTIIRPSGLLDTPAKGPQFLSISQGDVLAGFISRKDVAVSAVEAGLDTTGLNNVSFEVYDSGTAVLASTLSVSQILSDEKLRTAAYVLSGEAFSQVLESTPLESSEGRQTREASEQVLSHALAKERTGRTYDELFHGLERDE